MHQLALQQSLQPCVCLQKLLVAICHVVAELGQGNNNAFMSFTTLYTVIIFADITLIMHGHAGSGRHYAHIDPTLRSLRCLRTLALFDHSNQAKLECSLLSKGIPGTLTAP